MKLNGIIGKGTGKLGSHVYAVSGGQQIVRQYNPVVSNPNTEAQIKQRARLKLMSQVAAAMSPVIAIPKDGLKSSRNLFMKKNAPYFISTTDGAEVQYSALQLTAGTIAIPQVNVTYGGADAATSIKLPKAAAAAEDVSRMP